MPPRGQQQDHGDEEDICTFHPSMSHERLSEHDSLNTTGGRTPLTVLVVAGGATQNDARLEQLPSTDTSIENSPCHNYSPSAAVCFCSVGRFIEARAEDSLRSNLFEVDCPLCPSTHGVLRSAVEAAQGLSSETVGEASSRRRASNPTLRRNAA